jgi:hypothetical protein
MAFWLRVYPGVAVNIDRYRSLRVLLADGDACPAGEDGEKTDLGGSACCPSRGSRLAW